MADRKIPMFSKKVVLFLASQNLSLFGSSVVGFSIIWHITLETSSGNWITLFALCNTVPQVIFSLMGGVWADRYNRKVLIMLADAFVALATLGMAVAFWAGVQHLELLLAVSVIRSIGSGIQAPSVNAVYPQLVPPEGLTRVQGVNQTINSVLMLVSPAVGGAVLGALGIEWAFMLDVVTAALAIFIMGFIKVEKIGQTAGRAPVLTELRHGLDYTFRHPVLRRLMICFLCSFILITPAAFLSPLLVERTFGNDVWKLTANELVWTVGTLLGGLFVSLRGEFKNKVRTISVCLAGFGVCFGLLGVAEYLPVYLLIMGTAGLFMPVNATAQTVFIQQITQPEMMGRVFSIVQMITGCAMPAAILFFGPLADVIPLDTIMIVSGALLVLVGVWYYRGARQAQA
jgi:DHA3 family macrolide efflux protein-like MFS transporter